MELLPDTFIVPEKTISGNGAAVRLLKECAAFGAHGILAHGRALKQSGVVERLLEHAPAELSVVPWEHSGGEPSLKHVDELLKTARQHRAKWIAAVGGGSVMDLGKACAGLFHAEREPAFYHDGSNIESRNIAFVAAPTTAGSGAEATFNAVLTNTETGQKKSIRDSRLIARLVILDGDLLLHCPSDVIAASGMDAFAQAIESYVSRHASRLSSQYSLGALKLISENLERVFDGGTEGERTRLLIGSYLAGIALANARLGVIHGIAHPLGTRYHLPHGLVCGICLPHAIELNREAMGDKYVEMSEAVGGDLSRRILELMHKLKLPSPLKGRPIKGKQSIIAEALASGSTASNPKSISRDDIEFLLKRLF